MKKLYLFITGMFSLLIGAFLVERNKRKTSEAQLQKAEDAIENDKLKHQIEDKTKEVEKEIEDLEHDHKLAKEDQKNDSPEDYWKRRNSS